MRSTSQPNRRQDSCSRSDVRRTDLPWHPSDVRLVGHLKKHLSGLQFHTDAEVEEAVSEWFCSQVTELCAEGNIH